MRETVPVMIAFRRKGQFLGFVGSSGPSQSTRLGSGEGDKSSGLRAEPRSRSSLASVDFFCSWSSPISKLAVHCAGQLAYKLKAMKRMRMVMTVGSH